MDWSIKVVLICTKTPGAKLYFFYNTVILRGDSVIVKLLKGQEVSIIFNLTTEPLSLRKMVIQASEWQVEFLVAPPPKCQIPQYRYKCSYK